MEAQKVYVTYQRYHSQQFEGPGLKPRQADFEASACCHTQEAATPGGEREGVAKTRAWELDPAGRGMQMVETETGDRRAMSLSSREENS